MANVDVQPGRNEPIRDQEGWRRLVVPGLIIFGVLLLAGIGYLAWPFLAHADANTCHVAVDNHFGDRDKRGLWHWRHIGRNPAVPLVGLSQDQRMTQAKANVPCFVKATKIEKADKFADAFAKAIADGKGVRTLVKKGTRYDAVSAAGPSITFDAIADFDSRTLKKDQWATRYTVTVDGVTKSIDIFDKCGNIGLLAPQPHRPVPHERHAFVPPPRVEQTQICRRILLNYKGQSDVAWDNGAARVTVKIALLNEAAKGAFVSNPCTGVHDSAGVQSLGDGCWGDCSEGHYPEADVAVAVGLSKWEPNYTFHFYCHAGVCELWIPADMYDYFMFCVLVERYRNTVIENGEFSTSRFDVVDRLSAHSPLVIGPLAGGGHY